MTLRNVLARFHEAVTTSQTTALAGWLSAALHAYDIRSPSATHWRVHSGRKRERREAVRRRAIRYSAAELAFIESHRAMPRRALHASFVEAFGRGDVTIDDVNALCSRRGWSRIQHWRPEETALLREIYPDVKTEDFARRLGRPLYAVYRKAAALGLEKSEAYLASPAACRLRRGDNVGAAHRYPKGHAPANKGLRRPGWSPGRMKATQFKKGQQPHNTKFAGHERVTKDGYVEISVNERNPHTGYGRRYVLKHRWLWEQANGPVPCGMALKCLDSNKLNTEPSNRVLVPRGLLPRLNGKYGRDYGNAPAELKSTILAIAKLDHAARKAGA